ncbi:hypothetical protein Snoj_00320 [Streptomyces nojiriensis]|uniref:Uncharacterized protein n=1 Tax=Streptomyces nojiriensis TaxID=66374 RepID=A0ABQ3SDB0_9ACTN|nr:hypothetical protein [Streptomyces nojiriensis]QTI42265.1 hypothetical protein JYK04_00022 [Streptomyces nojiriensis]GGS39902.1 hypothetical protein GCM10010205_81930 [Streptomyces nojiriensis]GHI66114.1 hypothetical protein Snoj_00320 [Streptomyces nojiriensis]
MIEILDNLDVLSRPHLDLTTVEMGGTALGAPATSIPRRIIVQAQSSVVARYRGGTNIDSEYYDADGRRLTLDEVVDHAAQSDGFLYCADKLTYKIRAGAVVGFAIYGPQLSHFAHLTSYEDLLAVFGTPDRAHEDEAYGDLMGYDNYYWGAQKRVRWDAWDDRISLINLGAVEGNAGP